MNNMKKTVLGMIAKQVKKTASSAAGSTSFWGLHQPKEPECLRSNK
ncbi:cyclic lactone autoinducer peptide [Sedimentibacter sp. MB31-C6]|nr:cyclic lactone autoinducer peptide [Sedimentibacter sp. MB36-C1]WSI05217.1 cyclic lactone autoinducer peptide [Sedimentibacter sp. MB36-C1]